MSGRSALLRACGATPFVMIAPAWRAEGCQGAARRGCPRRTQGPVVEHVPTAHQVQHRRPVDRTRFSRADAKISGLSEVFGCPSGKPLGGGAPYQRKRGCRHSPYGERTPRILRQAGIFGISVRKKRGHRREALWPGCRADRDGEPVPVSRTDHFGIAIRELALLPTASAHKQRAVLASYDRFLSSRPSVGGRSGVRDGILLLRLSAIAPCSI